MGTQYRAAPEVERIAKKIIREVPDHKRLADVRVVYVFRDKASSSKGRIVLGTARKIGGLNAFLAAEEEWPTTLDEPATFFVVEIAANTWEHLTADQRRALVDHELCHLKVDENDDGGLDLTMRGHDIEEFAGVVRRHGLWASDTARFGTEVAEQLALAVDEVIEFVETVNPKAKEGTADDDTLDGDPGFDPRRDLPPGHPEHPDNKGDGK